MRENEANAVVKVKELSGRVMGIVHNKEENSVTVAIVGRNGEVMDSYTFSHLLSPREP